MDLSVTKCGGLHFVIHVAIRPYSHIQCESIIKIIDHTFGFLAVNSSWDNYSYLKLHEHSPQCHTMSA